MVLPMVSASKNVNAPNKAENGTNALWSLPTRILPICGTISPKKLITPATAVEILASSTAIREITIRMALTLIPRLLAVLSSSANRLHIFVMTSASTSPITTYGTKVFTSSHVFMVIFPLTMAATPDIFPPFMEFNALESPVNIASTATPTRMILRGLNPPFHDRL